MMDYMMNPEESCSLLSFRIRSARAKKRALRNDREKQLRKLDREESRLRQQQRSLGFVALDPPVMRGWKRSFVLREAVAKSSYAAFYQQVLDKINTVQTHHDRKFLVKKRFRGRKKRVPRKQHLRTFSAAAFYRLDLTEWERRKFHANEHWNGHNKRFETEYVFSDTWCFQLQVRPNMIHKVRLQSTLLEQRSREIDNYLNGYALRGRLNRLKGVRSYWRPHRYDVALMIRRLRRTPVAIPGPEECF